MAPYDLSKLKEILEEQTIHPDEIAMWMEVGFCVLVDPASNVPQRAHIYDALGNHLACGYNFGSNIRKTVIAWWTKSKSRKSQTNQPFTATRDDTGLDTLETRRE